MAIAQDLGLGNIGNVGSVFSTQNMYILFFVILGIFLIGIVSYILFFMLRFNIMVIIEERREHGTFVYTKKARIGYGKDDSGNRVQRLFIRGEGKVKPTMPPNSVMGETSLKDGKKNNVDGWWKSLLGTTKGGKRIVRILKEGDHYTVVPFTGDDVIEYLRVSKPVRIQWVNNQVREAAMLYAKKQDFLEKYGSYIALAFTLVIIMVIFIVMFNKFDNLKILAQSIDNQAGVLKDYVAALRELNTQAIK